jgi:hypothetical protein
VDDVKAKAMENYFNEFILNFNPYTCEVNVMNRGCKWILEKCF